MGWWNEIWSKWTSGGETYQQVAETYGHTSLGSINDNGIVQERIIDQNGATNEGRITQKRNHDLRITRDTNI